MQYGGQPQGQFGSQEELEELLRMLESMGGGSQVPRYAFGTAFQRPGAAMQAAQPTVQAPGSLSSGGVAGRGRALMGALQGRPGAPQASGWGGGPGGRVGGGGPTTPQPYSYGISPTGSPRLEHPYRRPGEDFNAKQLMDYLLALGYQGGAFDPEGSSAYANALRKQLDISGEGDIRRAQLGADMYAYDDPMARNYIRQSSEQSVRDRNAALMAQGTAGNIQANQQFLQDLLGAYQGAVLRRDPKPGDQWGAAVGQLGGAALGGWLGGRRP